MANINLLPWREWERERKQKEFLTQIAGVLVLGVVMIFGAGQFLDTAIENQDGRNRFLQSKITLLDGKIAEIQMLRKQREDLLARMQVINELQGNRPVIVRVFDEVVQTLAKGVHYKQLQLEGKTLSVSGIAESNNRISALMRNRPGTGGLPGALLTTTGTRRCQSRKAPTTLTSWWWRADGVATTGPSWQQSDSNPLTCIRPRRERHPANSSAPTRTTGSRVRQ